MTVESKFGLGASGATYGASTPRYTTGVFYGPNLFYRDGGSTNSTATRLYYIPFYVNEAHTFTGCTTANTGSGDNGERYRTGIYRDSTSGPGTLVGTFGEVTLTGVSSDRLQTANISCTAGWYWFAMHFEAASAMFRMFPASWQISSAGYPPPIASDSIFGGIATGAPTGNLNYSPIRYVDTAYGALASTAVAPTTDLNAQYSPAFVLRA